MRTVDDKAIRDHASVRFRSEYHYAVFEYWRSAKVLAYLDQTGVRRYGRVSERFGADLPEAGADTVA